MSDISDLHGIYATPLRWNAEAGILGYGWAPVVELIGWVPRDKVPPIALREPTVKPPAALDSQVKFALLEAQRPDPAPAPSREKAAAAATKPDALEDPLDNGLPKHLR